MKEPKIQTGYLTVCTPDGHLIHTMIGLKRDEIIEEFLREEAAMHFIAGMGSRMRGEKPRCTPSWEHFEAEGYRIVPVNISFA